jgi:hypothetical protein
MTFGCNIYHVGRTRHVRATCKRNAESLKCHSKRYCILRYWLLSRFTCFLSDISHDSFPLFGGTACPQNCLCLSQKWLDLVMPCDGGGSILLLLEGQACECKVIVLECAQFGTTNRAWDRSLVEAQRLCLQDFLCCPRNMIPSSSLSFGLQGFWPSDLYRCHWLFKDLNEFENAVDIYCHNTAYSMTTAAHILA